MTNDELFGVYLHERHDDGSPKLPTPFDHRRDLTSEDLYRVYLRLGCGVFDKARQDELWQAELARREPAASPGHCP